LIHAIASAGKCLKNGSLPMIFRRYSNEQTAGSTQSSRTGDFGRDMIFFSQFILSQNDHKDSTSQAYNHGSK
jgi:hypothetical protein